MADPSPLPPEPRPTEGKPHDEHDLASFGYVQTLGRSLGGFSSFAAGFAYISILTGLFQMFPLGYRGAGPAFFLTWPVVVLGQMSVALCFAELSAHYPLCGSVYQWAKKVGSPALGWMAGWISLAGSIVALGAVAMALQFALPSISPVFQLVGDASNPDDSAKNAVILACLLIALTTILNARAVTLLARFNNLGVIAELIGSVLLVVLLFAKMRHSPSIVFSVKGSSGHSFLNPSAMLAAGLTASYVLYGFETAGSLAEETTNPREKSPRAILHALGSAGLLGGLLILAALMAAPDLFNPSLGRPDGGLSGITTEVLGPVVGKFFLVIVAVAIGSCALAVQTGAVRLVFGMARDGLLPGSGALTKVGASKTPTGPAVVVGLLAIAILLANLNDPKVVEAVASVSVVWINLAYWLVTAPLLFRRLQGWPAGVPPPSRAEGDVRLFGLGRWALPVNVVAAIWGLVIVINTGWPRAEVYGEQFPQKYIAPLASAGLLILGALYYYQMKPGRIDSAQPSPRSSVHDRETPT